MKQQETVVLTSSFHGTAAGLATAAPPERPKRLPRSRRLWGREDGFTMSGPRR